MLLMLIITPFVLLWGEIFTRVLLPQDVDARLNIFVSDPVTGFSYKPGARTFEKGQEYNALYQINSQGLRDREYSEKKDHVFRVLLVGDSFSVSHGLAIEDSLSRQMEKSLQEIIDLDGLPLKIEVINTAHGGYSPYNYWKGYRRWAPVYRPDAVVVGLSPDDFDCSNENSQYLIEEGETLATFKIGQPSPPRKNAGKLIISLRKWLSWNSEFYILMRNYLYYNDIIGRIKLLALAQGEEQISLIQQFLVPQTQSMNEAWLKSFSYLRKLKGDAESDGVPMVLIPIPLKMEVDPKELQRSAQSLSLKPEQIDVNQPLRQITEFCKKEKIPLLDPRQAIRKRHKDVPCYFIYDGHWVAEGIRVAAASIARQWRNMRLPPWSNTYTGTQSKKVN